ncbi:MAG: response regulator [Treponema sp.]|nr:response regulator [Treponema sp.]
MADWVVVVDDDITNLKMAGHILSKANMRVSAVKSGTALLDFIKQERDETPDLILLDVMMPEMDGFETMRQLKAWEKEQGKSDIPVIFLTADEDTNSAATGLALGAMDFIKKPFLPELLTIRVQHIIELTHLRKQTA